MDTKAMLKTLGAVHDPEGAIVTLTLNLDGTGSLPQATRIFLEKEVSSYLSSEARPANVRSALKKIERRVSSFVKTDVDPGTKGLFLVAGGGSWNAVELKIPLTNFITVGKGAYLAPLLAIEAQHPRAFLVEVNATEAVIRALHLGSSEVLRTISNGIRQGSQERVRTSRSKNHLSTGPGRGGSVEDRECQRKEEAGRQLLHHAADAVKELHAAHPADAIFVAGPQESFGEFSSRLTPDLRQRAMAIGSRNEDDVKHALRELQARAVDRRDRETLEFHERRAQGLQAALGPRDVLEQLSAGQVERVFLNEFDPMPGVVCTKCNVREPGLALRCPYCSEDVTATSLTQDIVAHSLKHPLLALTFVGTSAGWLRDLGGLAALLTTKGARRRTTPALK